MEKIVQTPAQVMPNSQVGGVKTSILNPMNSSRRGESSKSWLLVVAIFVVLIAGVGAGKVLADRGVGSSKSTGPSGVAVGDTKMGADKEIGLSDEATFKDTAEGVLREGGIDGEGTHKLERNMGPKKDVYLTSTAIDLQSFVGKKVQVWGQTIAGQKAGWLMDVGRVKILD